MHTALGTTYRFASSLPLMQSFEVDMPIADMTAEAMQTARAEIRAEVKDNLPAIGLVAVAAAFVGCVIANWIVPGRKG